MKTLWNDLRFALRILRKKLSVTILVIVSLALGIAGNTTVFSVVDGLLYRPLPYEDPERLAVICERPRDLPGAGITPSSAANYLDWKERQTSYQAMGAMRMVPLAHDIGNGQREQLNSMAVTPGTFEMLGARPIRGRDFLPEEGVPGNDRVVLLSHEFWIERYGAEDPVGKSLRLFGEPYEIVGVLANDFEFLDPNLKLYIPLALDRGKAQLHRSRRDLVVLGRLRPGVSHEHGRSEMTRLMGQLEEEYPESNRGYTVTVLNSREWFPDPGNRKLLKMVQGGMFFVLLIACANVANLLLARGQHRARELAIRSCIGARRSQIFRQLMTESMVMALVAGILGLALATAAIKVIANSVANLLPTAFAPMVDARVLLFTLAFTLFGGLLFGLAPVLQTRRLDLVNGLKEGSPGMTHGRNRRLASRTLVVAELTLALIFLGGAGVLLHSFEILRQNDDPGFESHNLLAAQIVLPESRYISAERLTSAVAELEKRVSGLPGASGVSFSNTLPRGPLIPRALFTIDARPPAPDEPSPDTFWLVASPGYFAVLEIPLRQGRAFSAIDGPDSPAVAMVNEAAADRFWDAQSPLGESITILGRSRQIVGIVSNTEPTLQISSEMVPVIYLPWVQQPDRNLAMMVKSSSGAALTEGLRREILSFDPDAAIMQIGLLDDYLEQFWVGIGMLTVVLRGFGALALVLAAIGIYGILAFSVQQRSHEIGVRMAVGAGRNQVLGMIVRQGVVLAGIGIVLGIPAVLFVRQAVSSLFQDVVPMHSSSLIIPCAVLLAVTLIASFLPARRAAGVDPVRALRQG